MWDAAPNSYLRKRSVIRRRFAMARPFPSLRTRRSSKSGGGSRATFRAHAWMADPPGLAQVEAWTGAFGASSGSR